MRIKYLLGSTIDNELAFVDVDFYSDGRFSCSFDTVYPQKVSCINKWELAECYLDELDKETLYDMCDQYDCAPSDLTDEFSDYCEIQDLMDCSLYPETINVDGEDWIFESCSCGQHDLEGSMAEFTNEDFYDYIYYAWKRKHLQVMTDTERKDLEEKKKLMDFDEEEWIRNYLRKTNK